MATDPGRSWCVRRCPSMHSPATRSTCCRSSTGDMAIGPDVPGELAGAPRCAAGRRRRQPGIPSCRGGTGGMATGPDVPGALTGAPRCAAGRRRRQPGAPAAGNPGSPAAGAAPVTWPPARGVPGALAGAPRSPPATRDPQLQEQHRWHGHWPGCSWCAHRGPSMCCRPAPPATRSTCCRSSTGGMAIGPDVPGKLAGAPRCAASRRRRQPGAPAAGAAPVAWPSARMFLVSSPVPLDVLPAGAAGNQEHLLQEQHRWHGHRPGCSWCARRGPSMCCRPAPPATRSTSCRSSTGDMATDPGRSWCARRGPSITAGQRRQPGAPAAGAAPVAWPSARGVPGTLTNYLFNIKK